MSKTNYTKVEEALTEGLRKMEAERLLDLADEKSGKKKESNKPNSDQRQLLIWLLHELKQLHRIHPDVYEKLEISKKDLKKFSKDPSTVTPEEWEKLKGYREKVSAYRADAEKEAPEPKEDDLIERERKEQKTKRFNIKGNWIPLR